MQAMSKTKYNKDLFPLLAEGYAREGLNDKEISKKMGISTQSYYQYQKNTLTFLRL